MGTQIERSEDDEAVAERGRATESRDLHLLWRLLAVATTSGLTALFLGRYCMVDSMSTFVLRYWSILCAIYVAHSIWTSIWPEGKTRVISFYLFQSMMIVCASGAMGSNASNALLVFSNIVCWLLSLGVMSSRLRWGARAGWSADAIAFSGFVLSLVVLICVRA